MNLRQYKKKYFICEDDYGNKLYAGDTVELYCPQELNTTWTSIIYWSSLYGACVDSHPSHKKMFNQPDRQRHLYGLLNQDSIKIYNSLDDDDDTHIIKQGYCKKIKSFNKC